MKKIILTSIVIASMFTSCDKHQDESEDLYVYDNSICNSITKKTDAGTNQDYAITKEVEGIKFTKVTLDGYDSFYIEVNIYPSKLQNAGKGVVLLLQDGKIIKRLNQKIEVRSIKNRTAYSAIFKLSQSEVKMLKENRITDKLIGDKHHESVNNGFEIIDYLRCLTK